MPTNKNALNIDITTKSLIKFALPTIIMLLFNALYTMIDGLFVSNCISTDALASINIVFPIFNLVLGVGIMIATGGSAICGFQMGCKDYDNARRNFSLFVLVAFIIGIIIAVLGVTFIEDIVHMLGADEILFDDCVIYGSILAGFAPIAILQLMFQFLLITAGKPSLGLILTVLSGVTNIILDYVFIVLFNMGIAGAGYATAAGFSFTAIYGIIYFSFNKKSTLYFVKPKFNLPILLKAMSNGLSEMVTNSSAAITTFLFNIILMNIIGKDGVSAITIILYLQFLLNAVILGYSSGVLPVISYNHGKKRDDMLKKIYKISIGFTLTTSIVVFIGTVSFSDFLIAIFSPVGSNVFDIAKNGLLLFSGAYLFMGTNIFASSMFTAFSDGKTSATISLLRTLVFLVIFLLTFPLILDITGVWIAVPCAELASVIITIVFLMKKRKIYGY